MDEIRLMIPTKEYARDIRALRGELLAADDGDSFAGCAGLEDCASAEEWIASVIAGRLPESCPPDRVPADVFLAVRQSDDRIVGVTDLRHSLDNPVLSEWGGHIGYIVRPDERRKGYAAEMLRQNLEKARGLGLGRVMVTCYENNPVSARVIEKCGGVYERSVEVGEGSIRRYWIEL